MSKTFVISDTHFGHKRILDLQPRPFANVEEMDEALIANWNRVVSSGDTVIHLGDFAMGGRENIVKYRARLNGNIILVCGNHDYDPPAMATMGMDIATKYYSTLYRGIPIYMAHRPLDFEHARGRYRSRHPSVFLYGHIHANGLKDTEDGHVTDGHPTEPAWSANMGVELWNHTPQELDEVAYRVLTGPHKHIVLPEHVGESFE